MRQYMVSRLRSDLEDRPSAVWVMNLLVVWIRLKKKVMTRLLGAKAALKSRTIFFDGFGPSCRAIREGATTWRALHKINTYVFESPWRYVFRLRLVKAAQVALDNWWFRMANAQAVRNRHKLIIELLKVEIREIYERIGRPVRILSVACGSAEGMIEAAGALRQEGIPTEVLLIDAEADAIGHAIGFAAEHGLAPNFEGRVANVLKSGKIAGEFKPDVIEMAGLIDYFKPELATSVIKRLHEELADEGLFVTCNIVDNPERDCMVEVIGWDKMFYRDERELGDIVRGGGFEDVCFLLEPQNIHLIAIARKSAAAAPSMENATVAMSAVA